MLNERAFCHHVKLQPFAWQLQLTIKLCKPKMQTSGKHVQNTNYSVFMIFFFFPTHSEGEYGLRAYYWNTFWAPQDIVDSLKKLIPLEQKEISSKQIPHMFSTSGEKDFDLVTVELFGNNVLVI